MDSGLEDALKNGYNFLESTQLPSGEFPTTQWFGDISSSRTLKIPIKSVFVSSFVLHSLKYINKLVNTRTTAKKAIEFLLGEMEDNGFWRFYGKNTILVPDTDCTCCILSALKEWSVKIDYEAISERLLTFRNKNKVFRTWIFENKTVSQGKPNREIDWVVNANALYFYSLIDKSLPQVEQYLLSRIEKGRIRYPSRYYPFLSGIYCLTRALSNSNENKFEPAIAEISNLLTKNVKKGFQDSLSVALQACSLLDCSSEKASITPSINYLISNQESDQGWREGIFFNAPIKNTGIVFKWGGESITSALALEAISRYHFIK